MAMHSSKAKKRLIYMFGSFRLDPDSWGLELHARRIDITHKVFETLLLLVENADRVLKKEEMMEAIWPETCVEESNLSQNIYVLRKVLGNNGKGIRFIETIPKAGYRFVVPVKVVSASSEETAGRPDETKESAEASSDSAVKQAEDGGHSTDSPAETAWFQRMLTSIGRG